MRVKRKKLFSSSWKCWKILSFLGAFSELSLCWWTCFYTKALVISSGKFQFIDRFRPERDVIIVRFRKQASECNDSTANRLLQAARWKELNQPRDFFLFPFLSIFFFFVSFFVFCSRLPIDKHCHTVCWIGML